MFKFNDLLISNIGDNEAEFIPLFSSDDEKQMDKEKIPKTLPILPLRNTVLFPGVVIPITVGREKSIKLVKEAYKNKSVIGVVAQKNSETDNPGFEDFNKIGTIAYIIKVLQMPDNSTTIIIQGRNCFEIKKFIATEPYYKAAVVPYKNTDTIPKTQKFNALISSIRDLSIRIIKQSPNIPSESAFAIKNIESPSFLINFVSSNLNISIAEKQKLLEIPELERRANLVLSYMTKELQMLKLKNQIQNKVITDIDKQQRNYFLNQQLKTIQDELGTNPNDEELKELKEKAKNKKWSKEIAQTFEKELKKLKRMHPAAAEYSIQTNYLETLAELPWNEYTKDNFDLKRAQKILDEDHYGLEKVKERIIEYLAVLKLKGNMKSPIICLIGPPGVGKTSLCKAIAKSLDRNYTRMSLGGLRDEAEIRGHRKTYIGAMPGRIIQSLKKAKSSNPVFVLDEIDKIAGNTISGDPSAALLEVLDPEQNIAFYDNFLEIDYDLSKVMFITTGNTLNTVHPALIDRMEIIDISGYIIEEKIQIAKKHLIPKQFKEHGLKKGQLLFEEKIIQKIIEDYTRESGVRQLEKNIAKIIRNRIKLIVSEEKFNEKITEDDLLKIMGSPRFQQEHAMSNNVPGVATGLAWTSAGGEILFIEVSLSKGKGKLTLTGNLGDVMKESATLALEYLKAHSKMLNINPDVFEHWNIHLHVPEGATPKDGPSAGITMFTAMASAFTKRKVKNNIAMTGEITLRGKVMPVGGIKEKILAAKRSKITDIVMSAENKKDIQEIKPVYISGLKFHYINEMIEATNIALCKEKVESPVSV